MRKRVSLRELKGRVRVVGSGFRRVNTDAMSIEEYHEYLNVRDRRLYQRKLRHYRKLIDCTNINKLPGTNEMLLFTRIVDYFDRNHSLPGSYRSMLRKLAKGMRYDEIIPLEVRAMVFLSGSKAL